VKATPPPVEVVGHHCWFMAATMLELPGAIGGSRGIGVFHGLIELYQFSFTGEVAARVPPRDGASDRELEVTFDAPDRCPDSADTVPRAPELTACASEVRTPAARNPSAAATTSMLTTAPSEKLFTTRRPLVATVPVRTFET